MGDLSITAIGAKGLDNEEQKKKYGDFTANAKFSFPQFLIGNLLNGTNKPEMGQSAAGL